MSVSKFIDTDPKGVPHLFVEYGGWRVNPTHAADAQDLNRRAYNWASTRNLLIVARAAATAQRAKPKRCPVPQDDVCDYGRGITLEDAPRQLQPSPFWKNHAPHAANNSPSPSAAYNPEDWQQPTGQELGYGPFN